MAQKEHHKGQKEMEQSPASITRGKNFINRLKHPSQFSKPQLAVFVIVFGLIGYLLYHAFATAPLVATVEGENMIVQAASVATAKPTVPTGLAAAATSGSVFLTWNANPAGDNVDNYQVYYSTTQNHWTKVLNVPATQYTVSGLQNGTLYYFRISAHNSLGYGAWTSIISAKPNPVSSAPAVPAGLTAAAADGSVNLSWSPNAPSDGVDVYQVYYSTDQTNWTKNLSITGTNYTVTGLANGTPYYFRVSAHNSLGYGPWTATPISASPSSLASSPAPSSTAGQVINDSSASNGKEMELLANATMSSSFSLSTTASSLTVVAKADLCSGTGAAMTVKVDGSQALSTTVNATSLNSYEANVNLASGNHTLTISYTNDTSTSSCNRNLYVDVTDFYGSALPTPAPTVAISASPSSVTAGQSSTLTWASTNASSCTASGAWSGTKATSGSASTGALNQNSTYNLTCIGTGGSSTASTTVTVSGGGGGTATTFDQATAYINNRPAFTPTRTINVTSGSQLLSAISNLQAGDLVKATADFTLSNSSSTPLIISKRLSSPAVIDLSQYAVKIVYNGSGNDNAVQFKNAENIRIYGGEVSTDPTDGPSGDACVLMFASQYITWWNFKIHDCGGGGFNMFTGKGTAYSYLGPSQHNDIEGDITKIDFNANEVDPHTEKCTGIHGMNLSDNNGYDFSNNRIAVNVHDISCIGGGIEFGTAYSSPLPTNNTIILQCTNLTFKATLQTGSNCFQTWGYGISNMDIKYLEASNIEGHVYMAQALSGGISLASDKIEYGRATNTLLNPFEKSKTSNIWDTKGKTDFLDVAPLP